MRGNSKWIQRTAISRLGAALIVLGLGCSGDTSTREDGPERTGPGRHAPQGTSALPAGSTGMPGINSGVNPALGGLAPGGASMTCAEGLSNTSPVTPTVWLVIDGSGSMADDFGTSTRWESLRSALMDPDGVVSRLQQYVRFGMVIYSGAEEDRAAMGGCNAPDKVSFACGCFTGAEAACCTAACGGAAPAPTACADLVVVDPAISNFATLDAMYPPKEIGGWTPTDRALEHVVTTLPVLNDPTLPDVKKEPIYVILATDGAPNDNCGGAGGGGGGSSGFQPEVAMRVVNIVTGGVQKGMHMFVVSLAGDDAELRTHLEQVANIGRPGQMPFVPANKDDLVGALQQIIGGATCQIELNGVVTKGQECAGEVSVNGALLPCDSDSGWRLVNERTVQLQGDACTRFLATASQVHATFPCGVFRPD